MRPFYFVKLAGELRNMHRSHLKIMLSDAGGIKTILDFIEMKSTELPKIKLTEKLYDFIIMSKSEVAVQ